MIVLLVMRVCGLHWSWTAPTVLAVGPVWMIDRFAAIAVAFATGLVTVTGAKWHAEDVRAGGDIAAHARRRRTPVSALRSGRDRRRIRGGRVITKRGLVVGRDHRGRAVHIPVGGRSGRHTLVLGATGSGKTVTQAWIAGRLIAAGHGAVVVDPKGDRTLRDELHRAARRQRREFREWTPEGPDAYNPFAHGSDTELADKALAGETYTEPHYLRQAQRYLGHATRTLRAAGQPVTLATLTEAMSPRRLEAIGRRPRRRAPGAGAARLPRRPLTRATTRPGRHARPPRDPRRIRRRAHGCNRTPPADRASTCCEPSRRARSSTSAWTPTAGRCWPP